MEYIFTGEAPVFERVVAETTSTGEPGAVHLCVNDATVCANYDVKGWRKRTRENVRSDMFAANKKPCTNCWAIVNRISLEEAKAELAAARNADAA